MKKSRIFLSYRRDDSPGYVSRLEDELEREFGEGRVFRDATDIAGGTKWKNVIDANLHSSAVLILVIGPRWEQIWHERINDDVNYVALELQRAHELDVPIIPVTLDGTELSKSLDLGDINFIYESQFHDISDKQGRWRGDVERLVSLLESVPGIGPASKVGREVSQQPADKGGSSLFKWVAVAGVLAVVGIWLSLSVETDAPVAVVVSDESQPVEQAAALPESTTTVQTNGSVSQPQIDQTTIPAAATAPVIPDITGAWLGSDGTAYYVQQYDDGTFDVESPGYASGRGRFFTNMPGKFEIEMFGVGRGEFAVSTTGDKAMGWIVVDGQQQFDMLMRVE